MLNNFDRGYVNMLELLNMKSFPRLRGFQEKTQL